MTNRFNIEVLFSVFIDDLFAVQIVSNVLEYSDGTWSVTSKHSGDLLTIYIESNSVLNPAPLWEFLRSTSETFTDAIEHCVGGYIPYENAFNLAEQRTFEQGDYISEIDEKFGFVRVR